jgi:hypothetical protein
MPTTTKGKQAPAAVPARMQRGSEVSQPEPKAKPVHEIRIGRIKAVIWANDTEAGTRHNVTLRRIYKRDSGSQWEQSDSFGRDDLPLVIEVTHAAWLWIFEQHAGHA